MRKILLFLLCTAFSLYSVKAQDNDPENSRDNHKFINLGIFNHISTNGHDYESISNNLSFNLLWGISDNNYGLVISGLANFIDGDVKGVSIAGLFNTADELKGIQIGGLYNMSLITNGLQIGFANNTDHLKGLQIGMFNHTKRLDGLQLGGINSVDEKGTLQIGFGNLNSGSEPTLQIGLFNSNQGTANSNGMQFGLFNYSTSNDYPVGFVNIIKGGEKSLDITIDETATAMLNFRSGGRYLYGIAGVGWNFEPSHGLLVLEGGIGAKIHLSERFTISTELTTSYMHKADIKIQKAGNEDKEDEDNEVEMEATKYTFRIMPSFRISKKIAIFAGPSLNYLFTHDERNKPLFPSNYWWRKFEGNSFKQLNLGYTGGIRYIF